eukprot:Opistho-2@21869
MEATEVVPAGLGGGLRRTKMRFDDSDSLAHTFSEDSGVVLNDSLSSRSEESGVFAHDWATDPAASRNDDTLASFRSEAHSSGTFSAVAAHAQAHVGMKKRPSLKVATATKTVCRICEQQVDSNVLKRHSKACAMINKCEADIEATDELLLAGMTAAERRVCAVENKSNFIKQRLHRKEMKAMKELIAIVKRALSLDETDKVAKERDVLLKDLESLALSVPDALETRQKLRFAITKKADAILQQRKLRAENADVFALMSTRTSTVMPTINDFSLLKTISRGAFGQVYLARKRRTGDYYAIKVLSKEEMVRRNQVEHVKNERLALATINSPFVIRLYYCFQTVNYVHIVMEYASGGDIFSLLDQVTCMDEAWARFYTAELVLALEHIHSLGIVHRDIKPENLLISKDGHIKLADFGLCKIMKDSDRFRTDAPADGEGSDDNSDTNDPTGALVNDSQLSLLQQLRRKFKLGVISDGKIAPEKKASRKTTTREKLAERRSSYRERTSRSAMYSDVGTTDYMAPEVILGCRHGPSVDWWALGVCLFEFLVGVPPFYEPNPLETFRNIVERNVEWPEELSADAVDLIDQLLTTDVSVRIGANTLPGQRSAVRDHPFFSGTAWEGLSRMQAAFIPNVSGIEDTQNFRMTDKGKGSNEVPSEGDGSDGSDPGHSPARRGVPSPNANVVSPIAEGEVMEGEKSQLTEEERRLHADPENFGIFTFKNWNFLDDVNQTISDDGMKTSLPDTSIAGAGSVARKISTLEQDAMFAPATISEEAEEFGLYDALSKDVRSRMLGSRASTGSMGSMAIAAALSSMRLGKPPGCGDSSEEDEDDEDSLPLAARLGLSRDDEEAPDAPGAPVPVPAPATQQPPPAAAAVLERWDSQADATTIRCLVAEDNPVTQRIVQALMRQMGIAVEQAFDGRQAVDMALHTRYDIIFMDMMMPKMCGDEAAALIRTTATNPNREVPIIAFTAMDEDRKAFKKQGFTDLLCKPITRPELYQTLQKIRPKHPRQDVNGECGNVFLVRLDCSVLCDAHCDCTRVCGVGRVAVCVSRLSVRADLSTVPIFRLAIMLFLII